MKPVSTIHAKWSTSTIDTQGDRETLRQRSQENTVSPYGNIGVPTAVGLPDLIPYMYYFWKEDQKKAYLGITDWDQWARQNIQRFIFAVNQPCVRDGQQSAFTNTSVFDREYLMALFGGAQFPNGEDMIDHIEGIMEFQKKYMEVMAEIRHENMFTFPVSTISMVRKNGKFLDEEFAEWAIKHNMQWSDSNLFIDDNVSSLSNCCRLKSNIRDLGYVINALLSLYQ